MVDSGDACRVCPDSQGFFQLCPARNSLSLRSAGCEPIRHHWRNIEEYLYALNTFMVHYEDAPVHLSVHMLIG